MRVISYILFSLSLLVIMAHDFVPHVHEGDVAITEDMVTLPEASPHNLSHLLGHYKHNAAETSVNAVVKAKRKVDTRYGLSWLQLPALSLAQHGTRWYSCLKKQRFWEAVNISCHIALHSIPHRGPPAMYARA